MVDAEQTYFQTGINYLATELQRYYNKGERPVIYGTYQCYLKVNLILWIDIELDGPIVGVSLVGHVKHIEI